MLAVYIERYSDFFKHYGNTFNGKIPVVAIVLGALILQHIGQMVNKKLPIFYKN